MTKVFKSNFSIRSLLSDTSAHRQQGSDADALDLAKLKINDCAASQSPPSPASSSTLKPCFTYCALIVMAIRSSARQRLPLSGICEWIAEKFPFFKNKNKRKWQNSIRHNLSLNAMFKRKPRDIEDPGRGHYWIIDPNYDYQLTIGQNTGRLRRNTCAMNPVIMPGPIRTTPSGNLLNLSGAHIHPYYHPMHGPLHGGIPHYSIPRAVYFPTPEEQMRAAQMQAQQQSARAHAQALIQQHLLNQSMQNWNYYHHHNLPLLQRSLLEYHYIQYMFAQNRPM